MNRRDVNRLINTVIPVSSECIGSPRYAMKMERYCSKHPISGMTKKIDTLIKNKYTIPEFFNPKDIYISPEYFVAKLKEGRVWGRNGAVIGKGDCFITDVSREFNEGRTVAHSVFYTIRQIRCKKVTGNTLILGTAGAYVYYHWMLDVLPRLALSAEINNLEDINHFVTEYNGYSFQKETLRKLQIPANKIIASNDNWHFHIKAENLYVPSLAGPIGQPTIFQIDFLRKLYNDEMFQGRGFRKIYISRRLTARRMIINENEIIPILHEAGFEIIDCETLSVSTQVKLFSEASVIIGSHGSAFTNLVFCNDKTKVLDIFNTTHSNPCFWIISHFLNLDYYYLSGESVPIDNNIKSDNTKIDKKSFIAMLNEMQVL